MQDLVGHHICCHFGSFAAHLYHAIMRANNCACGHVMPPLVHVCSGLASLWMTQDRHQDMDTVKCQ